ncbi:MAG TPA: cyclic nucleotide-binding domain-containing protein [Pengzhenrongella sp.]
MKKTIEQYLPEHPFFAPFDPEIIALFAGCATNVHYSAGVALFHEGDAADTFYLVRKGRVSITTHQPGVGGIIIDSVDAGGVVGWSWLVPPYRWTFDARAAKSTSAVAFDATCLRAKCDKDPAVGYVLLQQVASVMLTRLEASRMRLLDLYGVAAP